MQNPDYISIYMSIKHFDFSGWGGRRLFSVQGDVGGRWRHVWEALVKACQAKTSWKRLNQHLVGYRCRKGRRGRWRGGSDRRSAPFRLSPLISEVSAARPQAVETCVWRRVPGACLASLQILDYSKSPDLEFNPTRLHFFSFSFSFLCAVLQVPLPRRPGGKIKHKR